MAMLDVLIQLRKRYGHITRRYTGTVRQCYDYVMSAGEVEQYH
jgi:hypothetical protein